MVHLYTFVISHFSEKVRFALDVAGVAYEEHALLPGAHVPTIRRLARGTTVPVLVHEGAVLQGSGEILDYAESNLGASLTSPEPETAAREKHLEALADHAFGRGVQTIFYDALLRDRRTMVGLWAQGGPRAIRALYTVVFPLMASRIRSSYGVTKAGVVEAKDRFRRAMDETDRALEGRAYLGGDAPGRADITLAALLAPVFSPPEHVMQWPTSVPDDLASFVQELEHRPTIDHARRLYRSHRHRRGAV